MTSQSEFKTLSISDAQYPSFLRGCEMNGKIPLAINTFGDHRKGQVFVTFELKPKTSPSFFKILEYLFQISRMTWLSLILLPTAVTFLFLNQKGVGSSPFIFWASSSLVFLYMALFILNDYFSYIHLTHFFYLEKTEQMKSLVRPNFPAIVLRNWGLIFVLFSFLTSFPLLLFSPQKAAGVIVALFGFILVYYFLKFRIRKNLSGIISFFLCGPLFGLLAAWYFNLSLHPHEWVVYAICGGVAFFVILCKHFQHIMIDDKMKIRTLATYFGFDGVKKVLLLVQILLGALFSGLFLLVPNQLEYYLVPVVWIILGMSLNLTIQIQSTVNSQYAQYAKKMNFVQIALGFLLCLQIYFFKVQ